MSGAVKVMDGAVPPFDDPSPSSALADGVSSKDADLLSTSSVCCSLADGDANVSGPNDVLLPNSALLKLLLLPLDDSGRLLTDVDFVGVGGRSSLLEWLSRRCVGELSMSSAMNEPRRVSCGCPTRVPKMLTPLPKACGEIFVVERMPKGVLGLPNSCMGCAIGLKAEPGAGVGAIVKWAFFEGVSGMCMVPYRSPACASMLL